MKFIFLETKFSYRFVTLVGLFLGIVILFSCSLKFSRRIVLEQEQSQTEILQIESFKELGEKKLLLLEVIINEIQIRDSLLTTLVFQDSVLNENSFKINYANNAQMDSCFEKKLSEIPSVSFEEENIRLRNILTELKKTPDFDTLENQLFLTLR